MLCFFLTCFVCLEINTQLFRSFEVPHHLQSQMAGSSTKARKAMRAALLLILLRGSTAKEEVCIEVIHVAETRLMDKLYMTNLAEAN